MITSLLGCQACVELFKAAGGDAAGWAIFTMLVIVVFMMVVVGTTMARIGKKQKQAMPDKYKDPLLDK